MSNFVNYVAYNQYGGISHSVPKNTMEGWLKDFRENGKLALGVWELQYSSEFDCIQVRIAPQFELDGRDSNWRSWNYSFYRYVI